MGVNTTNSKSTSTFYSDGKGADSIELVYTMKVSAAKGVVAGSNTFQSVPLYWNKLRFNEAAHEKRT